MREVPLPTRREINVHDSPDERTACEDFLGKSLDEAQALFREASTIYQGDLMWMGQVAFRFYVEAAIRYIQSPEAAGDSDMINGFAGTLEFRLEYEPDALAPVASHLASACRFITGHWDSFDATQEIYVGLRERYTSLEQSLAQTGSEAKPQ